MDIKLELLLSLKEKLDREIPEPPQFGLVLGTGLKNISNALKESIRIPYRLFEELPEATAPSHDDAFYFGYLEGAPVLIMGGRFHYYEGYSMKQITLPIRLLCMYPLKFLWISNATGSVNPDFQAGDLVFIRDHINMMPENPLRGRNDDRLGLRFPDMLNTYNSDWNAKCIALARELGANAHEGIYFALPGPNLETPAEYDMIHRLGGDVVGMSTVPEVLVARHMDTDVIVCSVISNVCYPLEAINETTVEQVVEVVAKSTSYVQQVLISMIKEF